MPFVIPFFIPHQGCPHQCLFCNQNSITGKSYADGDLTSEIEKTLNQWLPRRREPEETHFAFYGGSFTCLPRTVQQSMLETVQPWLRRGEIDAIRLSTRPDCVDRKCCAFLVRYGVRIVELGVQSLDDRVLQASLRGHTEKDCIDAIGHLREASLEVGIQLMPGLPLESRYSFMQTVKKAVVMQPSFARLYPALVVANSGLADLYKKGEYSPLSLEMAIALTAWARRCMSEAGIRVVRMGLQPSQSLENSLLAGPYHPAFGELVISRDWLKRTRKLLAANPGKKVKMSISPRDLSAFTGRKKANKKRLKELGLSDRLEIDVDQYMERGKIKHVVCKPA
jgi:histone acetyltransferase (RNA polymerase elongator complex component)